MEMESKQKVFGPSNQEQNKTNVMHKKFIDWSNDWHPIIMNQGSYNNDCTNCTSSITASSSNTSGGSPTLNEGIFL